VQTKNVMALLASPYPHNGSVVVVNQTAQLINGAGQPVPLSEVSSLLCSAVTATPGAQTEQRVRSTDRAESGGMPVSAVLALLRAFCRFAQSLSARASPRCTCTTTSARPRSCWAAAPSCAAR
jgi:hypothetical protein